MMPDAYQEFAGTIEIYNYRAGRYEKVSEEDELTGVRLEQCISLDHRCCCVIGIRPWDQTNQTSCRF